MTNLEEHSLESFESCSMIRISTAPSRPLTDLEEFKLSKEFSMLEQAVVCSNHLIHKTYNQFDLDSIEGQAICQKYLEYLERLTEVDLLQCSCLRSRRCREPTEPTFHRPTRCCTRRESCPTLPRSWIAHKKVTGGLLRIPVPLGKQRKV